MSTRKKGGTPLVIVESPAKARTIKKFLGPDFEIEASVGHIRDLPANAAEVPAKYKKEKWSRLGIDIENDFRPLYVVPKDKRDHLKKLKERLKNASVLYLATDEDREGESISWHIVDELKPKVEYKRLVFHEITREAIQNAIANPRDIDMSLVEAQETRRLMDRLFGYEVSPLLWKKIRPRLSAGRVQSVAVRLVIERERERIRFKPASYASVTGEFSTAANDRFTATLVELDGRRVATGKDFDPDRGELVDPASVVHLTGESANELVTRLEREEAAVESLEQKPFTERPKPPFTTSTLQQAAARRLGFTARRTMSAAQRLYENGFITYMRTDSTTLSEEALSGARREIRERFGEQYLPREPRAYFTKVKNAQEAHEAIRPAGREFVHPDDLPPDVKADERNLYRLIWQRTLACQMNDARGMRTTIRVALSDARFQATGRVIEFDGFRRAYAPAPPRREESPAADGSDEDRILPAVATGERLGVVALTPDTHTTRPPPRLTEATLIRELERRGIGRPSTYATIIDTILQREYCFKRGSALVPTFTAFAVIQLMHGYLEHLIDYAFTARMEDELDEISNGREQRLEYLRRFYHGDGEPGLKAALESVAEQIDPRSVCTLMDFDLGSDENGDPIEVRVGRYGPFLSCGETSATLPDGLAPDELTRELALDLIAKTRAGPTALGNDPESGLPVYVKNGRFGPYFQLGDAETLGDEKPKMASLLPGMDPESVTLDEALAVLRLPRTLGTRPDPETGEPLPVLAANGRYGPYLKWGKETRSLPPEDNLLDVTLERAVEILNQPKTRRGRARAAPKVLREIGEHPDTSAPVRILDGRYGPYITDGEVNVTVPKGESVEDLDLGRAVDLLREKASKKGTRKKTAKKKKTRSKTSKKTTTRKKASKKKSARKKADPEKGGTVNAGTAAKARADSSGSKSSRDSKTSTEQTGARESAPDGDPGDAGEDPSS